MEISFFVFFILALFPMWKMIHANKLKDWWGWYASALILVLIPPLLSDLGIIHAKKLKTISTSGVGRSVVSTRFYSLCAIPGKEIHSAECSSTTSYEKANLNPYSPLQVK